MDKRYLITILFCVMAGIIFFTLAYPAYQEVSSLERTAAAREEEFAAQNILVKEIGKLKAQQKEMQKETARIFALLPSFGAQSVPELFIELEGLASQSGVLIETISFANQNKVKGAGKEENAYQAINTELSLKGTYDDIKRFSQAIETSEHLMDSAALSLLAPSSLSSSEESKEKEPTKEPQKEADLFSLKVSLNAYYQ